jgi:hypothetical protein
MFEHPYRQLLRKYSKKKDGKKIPFYPYTETKKKEK